MVLDWSASKTPAPRDKRKSAIKRHDGVGAKPQRASIFSELRAAQLNLKQQFGHIRYCAGREVD